MIRDRIIQLVATTVASLEEHGALPHAEEIPQVEIMHPQQVEHGEFATNFAMKLAAALRSAGQPKANPRALADQLVAQMRETIAIVPAYEMVEAIEVAGPGFINFKLSPKWMLGQATTAITAPETFGSCDAGHGEKVNLEFVSANPTGLVTVGNGRGAFIGDTLGKAMTAAGFDVTREYYFNNAGGQVLKLGRSMEYYLWLALDKQRAEEVYAALPEAAAAAAKPYDKYKKDKKAEADESHSSEEISAEPSRKDGYFGPYYADVAKRLLKKGGKKLLSTPEADRPLAIGKATAAVIMEDIRKTMAAMGVNFDVWFNETDLVTSGAREAGIAAITAAGYTYEHDNATWAKTSQFGDEQDWVVLRSDGNPTYFASDIAYMRDKFSRGFKKLIYVLGADHHSYIARLQALAQMLGHARDDVYVLLYQSVRVVVDGKPMKMGKRLGNSITLDELFEEIGPDVTRFFYLMRSNDSHLDFNMSLALKQTDENPGLSVQYAHARASGVLRRATEQGYSAAEYEKADAAVLATDPPAQLDAELGIMRQLLRLEEVVERVALTYEPHHLTRYASELSDAFHVFYEKCPILRQGLDLPRETRLARLHLLRAGQIGLARALQLIGMHAPERMDRAETPDAAEASV
ncbi:MAG TPA: arginine--tRNA ligase [Ktedonobacterales bacterium]